jgi:carbon storage regulator
MLILTRRPTERIMIGHDIEIVVLAVKGQHVRLGIKAPKNVIVDREEIFDKKQRGEAPPGYAA